MLYHWKNEAISWLSKVHVGIRKGTSVREKLKPAALLVIKAPLIDDLSPRKVTLIRSSSMGSLWPTGTNQL